MGTWIGYIVPAHKERSREKHTHTLCGFCMVGIQRGEVSVILSKDLHREGDLWGLMDVCGSVSSQRSHSRTDTRKYSTSTNRNYPLCRGGFERKPRVTEAPGLSVWTPEGIPGPPETSLYTGLWSLSSVALGLRSWLLRLTWCDQYIQRMKTQLLSNAWKDVNLFQHLSIWHMRSSL